MSKRFAGLGRELLYAFASCVVASAVSFASAQVQKLTHAAAPPFQLRPAVLGSQLVGRPAGGIFRFWQKYQF